MKLGQGLTIDRFPELAHTFDALAGRHVPGPTDELGDRVLILDDRRLPSLELLRFHQELTAMPGFEVALRRRVARLRQFRDPSFAPVPAVEYLGGDRVLALLSPHTPGRRLSELLGEARGPGFATALVRELTPALASFHHQGDGIGHGALIASRIVITPEGRPVIVEHVMASALERLQLTGTRLFSELGIPVPHAGTGTRPRLDGRTDFFQLALIALSLVLGRRLTAEEYPSDLPLALERASHSLDEGAEESFRPLRAWLERALQLDSRAFPTSEDAQEALHELGDADPDRTAEQWSGLPGVRPRVLVDGYTEPAQEVQPTTFECDEVLFVPPDDLIAADPPDLLAPTTREFEEPDMDEPRGNPSSPHRPSDATPSASYKPEWIGVARHDDPVALLSEPVRTGTVAADPNWVPPVRPTSRAGVSTVWMRQMPTRMQWLVAGLALCAAGEAIAIGFLLRRSQPVAPATGVTELHVETPDPGASVLVDGRSAGVTPLQLKMSPGMKSISVVGPSTQGLVVGSTGQQNSAAGQQPGAPPATAARAGASPVVPAPAPQKSGGIRLVSPIEVEVFEGDRRLGSSATGIVSAPAGRHELDLVNSVLGYRSRQVVEVRAGQVVSLPVSPPEGRININASPWAEVWIDGKAVGETPLGNLSLPLGEHEIIFRHPQLGEQRRAITVRLDTVARISATFQR
jgi:hypothetical protein